MTRRQLAARLAEKTGLSARDAAQVLQQLPALMAEELARTRRLEWRALGTFAVKQHPARRIHVPATGQTVQLPARAGVAFKPSRKLLARLAPPRPVRGRVARAASRHTRS